MTTSLLPNLRPVRTPEIRAVIDQARRRIERHRDTLNLAAGLVLGGALLSTLIVGCALLLLEVIAGAVAPAARELGIGIAVGTQ